MPRFVWTSVGGTFEIEAPDENAAFLIMLATRLKASGAKPDEATPAEVEREVAWFQDGDQLTQIDGTLDTAPYAGPLPESCKLED